MPAPEARVCGKGIHLPSRDGARRGRGGPCAGRSGSEGRVPARLPGSRVVFPSNNVEKCGNVISAGPSRRDTIRAAMRAIAAVRIVLETNNTQTNAFLFHSNANDGRSAFTAAGAAARVISEMPDWYGDPASYRPEAALPVAAVRLSGIKGVDWHGVTAREAVRTVQGECGVRMAKPSGGELSLGRIFWRAFLRGGIQGARYLSDSIRAAASGGSLAAFLEELCGG